MIGDKKQASQFASDVVALALMLPLMAGGVAVSVAAIGGAFRYALYGDVPNITAALSGLGSQTQLIVLGAIAFVYWIVFNYLFGENVQESMDQAEEAMEMAEDAGVDVNESE